MRTLLVRARRLLNTPLAAAVSASVFTAVVVARKWRNWQTRRIQDHAR
jgi:hypothetical protein